MEAFSKGSITTSNLRASQNGLYGASLKTASSNNITLNGTNSFHDNSGDYGLVAVTNGNITVNNVTAYNQLTGLYLDPSLPANITINCGNIYNNTTGIFAQLTGNLTLNGVNFSNNTFLDLDQSGGTLVENPNYDCNPGGGKKVVSFPSKPIREVSAAGGPVELDCLAFKGTQLNLTNVDFVYFPCPISGNASLSTLEPENLPEGFTLHSGISTGVTKNGVAQETLSKYTTISFELPDGVDVSSLVILFFDSSEWIKLTDGLDLGGGKKVGFGGFVSPEGTYFQATVNFTGDFVLVSQ
jgi:hypothetical protein